MSLRLVDEDGDILWSFDKEESVKILTWLDSDDDHYTPVEVLWLRNIFEAYIAKS